MSSELTPTPELLAGLWNRMRVSEHGMKHTCYYEFFDWHAAELAAAWAEGHDAGWDERDEFVHYGAIPSGIHQSAAVNPYLTDQEDQ